MAVDRGRCWVAQGPRCAAARSLSGLANLAGFCRDSGWIRDKTPNSVSDTPLAPRINHITNTRTEQRYRAPLTANTASSGTTLFHTSQSSDPGRALRRVEVRPGGLVARSESRTSCRQASAFAFRTDHGVSEQQHWTMSRPLPQVWLKSQGS